MAESDGHGANVAKHYNELKEAGLEERTKSRIFYLRNFNNWIKSMLIGDFLQRLKTRFGPDEALTVLDLCGGKGGDLLKWKKGGIDRLVLADIAGMSVEQAEGRYKEMKTRNQQERYPSKLFSAQFITADCSKERLRDSYLNREIQFHLSSCQFSFHYSFESIEQADMMFRNACENLRPGGYFVGTTPDAHEIVKRLRAADDMSFGNEVYRVTYLGDDKENIPLFGAKYDFHLEGVVDCPEFLVYFPVLEKIAERYGMQLIMKVPFSDFFNKHIKQGEGRGLIGRMQSLEPYPAEEDIELMSPADGAYAAAKAAIERITQQQQEDDGHRRKPPKVGTLSQSEWEASTIYLVFAFQKIGTTTAAEPPTRVEKTEQSTEASDGASSSRKRPAESVDSVSPSKVAKTEVCEMAKSGLDDEGVKMGDAKQDSGSNDVSDKGESDSEYP